MDKRYKNLPIRKETHKRVMSMRNDEIPYAENVICFLLDRFEDFKRLKKINLGEEKLTDDEKLKMLKEQGRKIVEEVERLEKNKLNQGG